MGAGDTVSGFRLRGNPPGPGRAQSLRWEQGLGLAVSDQGSTWGLISKCFEGLVCVCGGHTKELEGPCCLRAQGLL